MSACDTCPKPGACCSGFSITHLNGDWVGSREGWDDDVVNAFLEKEGLPFVVRDRVTTESVEYIRVACLWLTPLGRCGNYDQRPNMCRNYEPESNWLCVLHPSYEERDDKDRPYQKAERVEVPDSVWHDKYEALFGDRDTTPTEFPTACTECERHAEHAGIEDCASETCPMKEPTQTTDAEGSPGSTQ